MLLEQGLPLRQVLGSAAQVGSQFARQRGIDAQVPDIVEERVHRVEVRLRDRIVFVVMALGAFQGQPKPDRTDRVRAVKRLFKSRLLPLRAALAVAQRVAVEAGRDQLVGSRVLHQIGGKLKLGELVEGHVRVQGLDDPVPPAPGVRASQILFVAIAVGVAGEVQPVARPLLAVMLGSEEPVNQSFVGAGAVVSEEGLRLPRRWRQARQVQAHATQQGRTAGFGGRREALGLQLGKHEPVDRIADPDSVLHRRRPWPPYRLERPVGVRWCARVRLSRRCGFGPGTSLINPGAQDRDLLRAQPRLGGRHLKSSDVAGHPQDQGTPGTVTGQDRGSAVAALEGHVALIEAQAVRLYRRPVAGIAALMKDGLDIAFEIDAPVGRGRQMSRLRRSRRGHCNCRECQAESPPIRIAHWL